MEGLYCYEAPVCTESQGAGAAEMEGLYCSEAPACSEGPLAPEDKRMLEDERVLGNLLQLQPYSVPSQNYFRHIQNDVQPFMRKVVTKWMLEVCEEQGCEEQVFAVAVNFVDRFLCVCVVQRSQLQLLAAVCLLLASKLRQCTPLNVKLLSCYTDFSVSEQEIKSWEMLVINKLQWDLSPVTPFDYVDHLICRVPVLSHHPTDIRKFATGFLAQAITEPDFMMMEPSALAVAAIASAVQPIVPVSEWNAALETMSAAINVDPVTLHPIIPQIEMVVERDAMVLPTVSCQSSPVTPTNKQQTTEPMDVFDGNKTPTEVTDIHF